MLARKGLIGSVLVLGLVAMAVTQVPATAADVDVAAPQGSLRAADPTMARDGDRWVSLSTNERLGPPEAVACDPSDPVWQKGFAYFPYRVGPAPDQLADCWAGDALPDGPGPWADKVSGPNWAPSLAKIGDTWWLFYVARKSGSDPGQQCIGAAASNTPTGPGWFHAEQPLVCPANGQWAIDPEIFYDRQRQAWYLLWDHVSLNIQRFDPATGALTGPVRPMMHEAHPDLGFDEFLQSDGSLEQTIENPTMVRADSGELWLFFSAGRWTSNDYSTGWALCGRGNPTEGGECTLVNSLDPETRYRPWWGWSLRTAPEPNVDARPFEAFPDVQGLGGMSMASTNPTAGSPQPVYATAHMYWAGSGDNLRTQHVFRLSTSGDTPVLTEP